MPNTKNMPPLGCVVRVWWVGMKGDAPNTKDTPPGSDKPIFTACQKNPTVEAKANSVFDSGS